MAKAKATSSDETPAEPLPPPPEFGGEEFSTRLPFVHPEVGQVIKGRILRKVTRVDRLNNKDREKQILVLELLAEFDNGGGSSRMYIGEQVQFDVRAGYGALFDLTVGDEVQLKNRFAR